MEENYLQLKEIKNLCKELYNINLSDSTIKVKYHY